MFFMAFFAIFLIITLGVMLFYISKNMNQSDKKGYIGLKANLLIQSYHDSENALLFIDQSSKYAASDAYWLTGFDGAIDDPEGCGEQYNFAVWDFEDQNCLPVNEDSPSESKIKGSYEKSMNIALNDFFSLAPEYPIPLDNYQINMFEEDGKIKVSGEAVTPITFDIKKYEGSLGYSNYNSLPIGSYYSGELANEPHVRHLLANNKYVTPEFLAVVTDVANDIGANPLHLMIVMRLETAGSFSPSIKNPTSSATGLIQFMASTARGLGTTTAQLADMNAVDQMNIYVRKYFKNKKRGSYPTLTHLYLDVLWPAGFKDATNPDAIIWKANSGKAWELNYKSFVPKDRSDKNVYVRDIENALWRGWNRLPKIESDDAVQLQDPPDDELDTAPTSSTPAATPAAAPTITPSPSPTAQPATP